MKYAWLIPWVAAVWLIWINAPIHVAIGVFILCAIIDHVSENKY